MPWWGWMIVGAVLLGAEMFVVDAQFYLVFLGVSAVLVGALGLVGILLPDWAQWLAFALFAVLSMLAFRRRVYEMVRRPASGDVETPVKLGDRVMVSARLAPGETCRVDYRGSTWSARNAGERIVEAGSEAEILRVDGLTLYVK